jgi:hypothetical protein
MSTTRAASRLPFWLARVLGLADGAHVKTCGVCGERFSVTESQRAIGYPSPVCSSEACFQEASDRAGW